MKSLRFGVLLSALLCLAASQSRSDVIYADGGGGGSWSDNVGNVVGTRLSVTAPVEIGSLGVFDMGNDGLWNSHAVGLWDSTGTLLGQVTVPSGTAAPLYSNTRWAPLNGWVNLTPGNDYIVGALFAANDPDHFYGSALISPGFTLLSDRYIENVGVLTYPNLEFGLGGKPDGVNAIYGFFGGNLSSVPEPAVMLSTLVMLLVAVGVFLHYRRKALAGV
jgi:hypothetical protein